jgi:hypothetical protein
MINENGQENPMENKTAKPHISVDYFEDLTGKIETVLIRGWKEIGTDSQCPGRKRHFLKGAFRLTGFDIAMLDNIESSE